MIEVSLKVKKRDVYEEIEKITEYTGAKKEGEEGSYNRIRVTRQDYLALERFWREACDDATSSMTPYLKSVSDNPVTTGVNLDNDYEVILNMSSVFDNNLEKSISDSLFSYFVNSIISNWYKLTNKDEAETAAAEAVSMLADVMRKIVYKKAPERP